MLFLFTFQLLNSPRALAIRVTAGAQLSSLIDTSLPLILTAVGMTISDYSLSCDLSVEWIPACLQIVECSAHTLLIASIQRRCVDCTRFVLGIRHHSLCCDAVYEFVSFDVSRFQVKKALYT